MMCLCLSGVFCSVEEVTLVDHTTVAQIAYIKFSQSAIDYDFGRDVDVLCLAKHVSKHKERHLSEVMFSCFSSLEASGVFIEVDSIRCEEDKSNSDLVRFTNPLRLDGCVLVPVVKALPYDYEQRLQAYAKANEWLCAEADCSSVNITMYQVARHSVARMLPSQVKCGPQVCYMVSGSTFDFYKKLFYLMVGWS